MVLEVWPLDELYQHHPCAFMRNANSLPHPYLLNQKLLGWGLTVCFNSPLHVTLMLIKVRATANAWKKDF